MCKRPERCKVNLIDWWQMNPVGVTYYSRMCKHPVRWDKEMFWRYF